MQNHNKKEMILDAMQELMGSANVQAISVSDIAQKAGIGKGSIYYSIAKIIMNRRCFFIVVGA